MRSETLIVEDLLLLLLDDETGTPAGAGTLPYTLGGAVLAELALLGRVETQGKTSALNGPEIVAVGEGPLPDPLLQAAYDQVAEKTRRVQPLLLTIGGGLWKTVTDRLIERGLIRREKKRVLGLFPTTRLPAADTRREEALRQEIRAVLEEDKTPDARTAAVTALLSASGALPSLRPALAWSGKVHQRAKEIESGNWGASAVNTAVTRTAAGIAASTAAVAVTVVTAT
ncbi:GOLPH3/VPS74 family protein [Amycolatopsis pittospori]|uniref:GOLPH3/VPS74 family protein n=1 Tax=Amycolatopsis pittospori TaxID=2749434 RepID=UPI0015F0C5DF|nr:GPP34 family phosphoprotein [Amycolatopsis pittospori]